MKREAFEEKIYTDEMAEYNEMNGHLYGTEYSELRRINNKDKTIVMDVDIAGAWQLKQRGLDFNSIYILPPSLEFLEHRLREK